MMCILERRVVRAVPVVGQSTANQTCSRVSGYFWSDQQGELQQTFI